MRLDMFLKVSRLMPRRSLAQEFCNAGLIEVNGTAAKSGKEIKVGDEITIKRRDRHLKIRAQDVPDSKQVSKQSAGELYEVISETKIESA